MWTVKASDGFQAWFRIQDADTRAAIAAAVRFLEVDGPQLGRPRADTLNGSKLANLKELRVSKGSEPVRCVYISETAGSTVMRRK
ncbi:type II toxin-antitoxin system RelE/ParE family toxin [Salmonella enterica]|nr:type II toxin-antitoxin system RelE/ParE family toxin [Salmonella enterica]ELX8521926.1 type II toxin-antitoxin system RelE/ParE family toxin [Salmonella enterica]